MVYSIHKSRFTRIQEIAEPDWSEHDLWGNAMGMFFAVASVLDMTDIEGDVTPKPFDRWQYGRGMGTVPDVESVAARAGHYNEGEFAGDYSYGEIALAEAFVSGEITQSDLVYAGDVLSRYTDLLRSAGKDY